MPGSSKAVQITQAGSTTVSQYEIQGMHPLESAYLLKQTPTVEQLAPTNGEPRGLEWSYCA